MIAAGLNLLADLVSADLVLLGGFEICEVKYDVAFMIFQFEMNGELGSIAFPGGVLDFLVDTADDLTQKIFFLLKYAFAEHVPSSAGFVAEPILAQWLSAENLRQ